MVVETNAPKILVVDDERLFRKMVQATLRDEFGVVGAENLQQGLQAFRSDRPDAVLMDVVMPGRNGLHGLAAIKKLDPHVSVMMLTGFPELKTAEQAMSLGASYYLEKPIREDTLRKTVRACVERTRARRREVQTVEEMRGLLKQLTRELSTKTQQASQAGAAIELMYDITNPLDAALAQMRIMNDLLKKACVSKDQGGEDMAGALSLIEHNLRNCRELADMCRNLSLDSADSRVPLSIGDVLNEIIDDITPWASRAGVNIDFRLRVGTGKVMANLDQIRRALSSPVIRAVQASAAKRDVVRVSCMENRGNIEIRVEDHGDGYALMLDDADKALPIHPKDAGKGYGMGLCLTNRTVERLGGGMTVQTAPGRGTVVLIRLPVS
jgi:DNA-binding response OmpR family regulator